MTETGTFDRLVAEVGQALLPLRRALSSTDAFIGLLRELGWTASAVPQPLSALGTDVETLYGSLRRLLGDGGISAEGAPGRAGRAVSADVAAEEAARVLAALQGVVNGIRGIADAPDSAIPASLRADGFRERFPKQLLDHLVVSYLQRFRPGLGFGLHTLGVVRSTYTPQAGNRPDYTHVELNLADLPGALADPALLLKNAFGWGEPGFDFQAFASQADNLLTALGFQVTFDKLSEAAAEAVQGVPVDPFTPPPAALAVSAFDQPVPAGGRASAGVRLLPVPGDGVLPPGFALLPSFTGELGLRMELGADVSVTLRSGLDLQGGVALVVRPDKPIDMVVGFESDTAPVHATGAIEAVVERSDPGGQPVLLLGSPDGTRLQFRTIGGIGGVRLAGGAVDAFAEFDVRGLEFVLKPGADEADGFISAIVPPGGFSVGADLALGVSHHSGLYFRGTSNLDIQLPAHREIGPLEIQGLTVAVAPSGADLPVTLGVTLKARLGPVTAVVDRVGLTALFTGRPDHGGRLGPLDVTLGFKPPGGVGLSVEAAAVHGGGFLAFDRTRGEYAGAMELEFADVLALKAIGLLSTRMPDGSDGFSLLVVLSGEFGDGIQLGYGFTLLAVGGILGLNRGVNLQALAQGVRTGAVESVMFPRDVIANAPRILSDLNAFFPAEQGTFLIGPMARIGWGTPTLLSISLGLIIEVPGNIVVLGTLRAVLPTVDLPLVVLRVDFVGALELDKSRLWFVARLFDSRILTMTVDGGMGLLVAWGDNPDLVVTVGGFHPSYQAPALPFPVPERLSVDILHEGGQLIRVSGYLAITSNTVQFGADAELRLGFGGFGIQGHLSFDALFHFSPFRFAISISAEVALKAFGVGLFTIDLRFQLEGPAPWRAHGRGSIGFLFFEISADFDLTWGEDRITTLPPVTVLPLLAAELLKAEGWSTRLPTGSGKPLVTLRQLPRTGDLVLHPLGTLTVRQRALPLNVRIDRVGGQRVSDSRRFRVAPAPDGGLALASVTGDKFAMAQFQDMSDAAKLSRPAYETQDAGLELTAAGAVLASGRVVRRSARYELHVIDSGVPAARRPSTGQAAPATAPSAAVAATSVPKRFHDVSPLVFDELLRGSSNSRSPLSRREASLRQPFAAADTVRVADQRFVVAYTRSNLQAFPPGTVGRRGVSPATFRSRTTATDALAEFVAADPALDGRLHVIPASEAAVPPGVPGTWAAAGVLPSAVSHVDAVVLATGKVLIAGGTDATGAALADTALFDPTASTWSPGAPLLTGRRLHSTTLLADGRVLAVGGRGGDGGVLGSAEVYDQAAGAWSAVPGPTDSARFGHSATLLPGGSVLIAGGCGGRGGHGTGALSSAELFDPVTSARTPAAPLHDARCGHQAVLLRDGRVLVVGGALPTGGDGLASAHKGGEAHAMAYCELYDPATGAWAPTGSLTTARKGHQATLLPDGRVLVCGGDAVTAADGTFSPGSLQSAELYDPGTGRWTQAAAMPGGRARHRGLLTRFGSVLVLGGAAGPGFTAGFRSVIAYDAAGDRWTAGSGLLLGRSAAAVAELADGRVLVAGGVAAAGAATAGPDIGVDALQLTATAEALLP
ncbi:kelch repeat-containing protein [Streptomyces spectabilis]|uniref:DUF6603 domain-containing protein n=1 Tax=Streptomyces spectabilis TaxID=68270 RepID=A0A516R1T8_STRST|nr:kelch repeat-containing protein [Streptomyces spectabilis]QDQ09590.1 hypothetical protein FH965_02635 [Streptomyces spectabilis]